MHKQIVLTHTEKKTAERFVAALAAWGIDSELAFSIGPATFDKWTVLVEGSDRFDAERVLRSGFYGYGRD